MDAIIVILTPQAMTKPAETARAVAACASAAIWAVAVSMEISVAAWRRMAAAQLLTGSRQGATSEPWRAASMSAGFKCRLFAMSLK